MVSLYNTSTMVSLRSKITQKVLSFLFLHQDERFYINELSREIKEDVSNVYKKLKELKRVGILGDEFQGNQRYFFINKQFPFLKEYESIILKGVGFEKILNDKLKIVSGIEEAYLFGSYIKDKLSLGSDLDILIIGDFDGLKLQKALILVQSLIGREINSVELSRKEFWDKRKNKDPFLEDIFSGEYKRIL